MNQPTLFSGRQREPEQSPSSFWQPFLFQHGLQNTNEFLQNKMFQCAQQLIAQNTLFPSFMSNSWCLTAPGNMLNTSDSTRQHAASMSHLQNAVSDDVLNSASQKTGDSVLIDHIKKEDQFDGILKIGHNEIYESDRFDISLCAQTPKHKSNSSDELVAASMNSRRGKPKHSGTKQTS